MGLKSRTKGKTFERAIARQLRAVWPDTVIRRASQAERAHNPDVFVEHGPLVLKLLWLELQDAAHPTPAAKLEQAEVDAGNYFQASGQRRWPVVVWHRIRERTIHVTLRVSVLDALRGNQWGGFDRTIVTLSLNDLIATLQRRTT
jgi:hypothetical protein